MSIQVAPDPEQLARAAALLKSGGVVAFPTETYYGLAVDPFNIHALEKLFAIKNRPSSQPILVLIAEVEQIRGLAPPLPAVFQLLISRFWPGPLTLVCPALPTLPDLLTGKTGTVGIRQSPHPVARALVSAFGGPITATSANRSGEQAAVTASEVAQSFAGATDLILDGGSTPGGAGSTLVGLGEKGLVCLREGRISFSLIESMMAW